MRLFQYQVRAFPVSTSGETITVDKWLGSEEVPQSTWKRKVGAAAVVLAANTAFAFTPAPPFPETVSIDRWHPSIEQPRLDRKRNQYLYESVFLGDVPRAAVVPIDRWHPEIEKPRWDLKRQQHTYPSLFYADIPRAENVTVDRWHPEIERPPASRKRNQYLYPFLFQNENPIDSVRLDQWFVQAVDRHSKKAVTQPDSSSFVYPVTVTPVVVPFDWQSQSPDILLHSVQRQGPSLVQPIVVPAIPFDWQIQNQDLLFRTVHSKQGTSSVQPIVSPAVPFDWSIQNQDLLFREKSRLHLYPFESRAGLPDLTVTLDQWNPAQVYIAPKPIGRYWLRYGEVTMVVPGVHLPCILEADAVLVQPVNYLATLVQPVEYDATLVQPVNYNAEEIACE